MKILLILFLQQAGVFTIGKTSLNDNTLKVSIMKYGKDFQEISQPYLGDDFNKETDIIWGDFNFDGYRDISITNGLQGSYGAKSYNVYVYNITKKAFVRSEELSELAHNSAGMFEYFPKTKTIKTYDKEGCCKMHFYTYKVVWGKGLRLVEERVR